MLHELLSAVEETLFMVFTSGLLTWIIGLPLGAYLSITRPHHLLGNAFIHKPLSLIMKTALSIPYLVFMIALIPFTRYLTGAQEGTLAAILPLTLAGIPHFAKLTENAINKIPQGLIETAQSVGATPFQTIYKVLIPEALPEIIQGLTSTLNHLLGFSLIAGTIGAGGLGNLVIVKGYYKFQVEYIAATIAILMLLTLILHLCGNYIIHGNLKKMLPR